MVTIGRARSDAVFRAIADPTRRRILGILRTRQHTVGELALNFQTSRPAISKHLRQLRGAGLVTTTRHGNFNVCQLNAEPLIAVNTWLQDYQALWDANLQGLKRFVESGRGKKAKR